MLIDLGSLQNLLFKTENANRVKNAQNFCKSENVKWEKLTKFAFC